MQAHPEPLSAQDVMSLSAGPCPHNNVDKTNVWVVLRRNEERAKAATARTAKAAVLAVIEGEMQKTVEIKEQKKKGRPRKRRGQRRLQCLHCLRERTVEMAA